MKNVFESFVALFYWENMKKENVSFGVCAVLTFLVIAFVTFKRGPITSSDSLLYTQWAQILIAKSFNLNEFYMAVEFFTPLYFYTFTVFLMAVLQLISPSEWKILFLFVNLASIGIILVCIHVIGRIAAVRSWILCFVPLLFLLGDALLWPAYILSDIYYAALVMLVLVFLIRTGKNSRVALFAMLFILMLTRPTAPAVLAGVIASMVLMWFSPQTWSRYKLAILFITGLLSAAMIHGFMMKLSLTGWIASKQIDFLREMVVKGLIIHDRPETWLEPSTDFLNLVFVFLVRFVSFFKPWVASFSLMHNLMLCIFISTFVISTYVFFTTKSEKRNKMFRIQFTLLVVIFLGAIYHAATLIDYDWRYRFPYAVPMALCTIFGIESWFRERTKVSI